MPIPGEELERELKAIIEQKHCKNHPVVLGIQRGELTLEQLIGFVRQYYLLFAHVFPKSIAALYGRCPDDPDIEKRLLHIIIDEGTRQMSGSASHRELYVEFASYVGISRGELESTEPLPETSALLNWRETLLYKRLWIEAMAAHQFVWEGQEADISAPILEGLLTRYVFVDEEVVYWKVSTALEDHHGIAGATAVEKFARTDEEQRRVRKAVRRTADALWLFFDGVGRAFIEEAPGYERWRGPTA